MIEYKEGLIHVKIDLNNGIYTLGFDGGDGKTRLHDILTGLSMIHPEILTLTYNRRSNKIEDSISTEYSLIMIDRMDILINNSLCDKIKAVSDDTIILCDLKDCVKLSKRGIRGGFATVTMYSAHDLEVNSDEVYF